MSVDGPVASAAANMVVARFLYCDREISFHQAFVGVGLAPDVVDIFTDSGNWCLWAQAAHLVMTGRLWPQRRPWIMACSIKSVKQKNWKNNRTATEEARLVARWILTRPWKKWSGRVSPAVGRVCRAGIGFAEIPGVHWGLQRVRLILRSGVSIHR